MQKKEELIRENHELRTKLRLAEEWMKREVQGSLMLIQKEKSTQTTRKYFSNIFEEEGHDILESHIQILFGDALKNAPKYTFERLIDAEIYWYTLQKYPHMDAFPIVASYQKILDAWIEETCIAPWRRDTKYREVKSIGDDGIEKDLALVISKSYTLSFGRWYNLITFLRSGRIEGKYSQDILAYWMKSIPGFIELMRSEDFYSTVSILSEREVFSKKRHEKKVSYKDASLTREICLGIEGKYGLIKNLIKSAKTDAEKILYFSES